MVVVAMVALGALFLIWPYLRGNLSWVYFIEHVAFTAAFGLLFARTLVGGRQPLCTFFASLLQQQMSTAVVRYTRQVTVVWSGFLFMLAGTSVLLFFMAPLEVWSVFANFLTLPLIGLMFVLEYLARMVVLPREEHLGLTSAFRAYQKARATRQWATPAPNDPA